MSDTVEYVLYSEHVENLESGALVAPGDHVKPDDLGESDQWLIDEGKLVDLATLQPTQAEIDETKASPDLLTGKALTDAARDAGVEAPSKLSADELRQAVSQATAPPSTDPPKEG